MLSILDSVQVIGWRYVEPIVSEIRNGNVEILEKKWEDQYKNDNPEYYPLKLEETSTWSTYDSCVDITFSVALGKRSPKVFCKVKIYDGEMLDGRRTRLRFTASMYLPSDFILQFESTVKWRFKNHMESEYENYLRSQMDMWINHRTELILENTIL